MSEFVGLNVEVDRRAVSRESSRARRPYPVRAVRRTTRLLAGRTNANRRAPPDVGRLFDALPGLRPLAAQGADRRSEAHVSAVLRAPDVELADAAAMPSPDVLLASIDRAVPRPFVLDRVEEEQCEVLSAVIDPPEKPRGELQAGLVDRDVRSAGATHAASRLDLDGLGRRVRGLSHQEQAPNDERFARPLLVLDDEQGLRQQSSTPSSAPGDERAELCLPRWLPPSLRRGCGVRGRDRFAARAALRVRHPSFLEELS